MESELFTALLRRLDEGGMLEACVEREEAFKGTGKTLESGVVEEATGGTETLETCCSEEGKIVGSGGASRERGTSRGRRLVPWGR